MARKKEIEVVDRSKSLRMGLDQLMSDRFGRYSKYIIQERALPDARDGLKPVQRRILYAMYEDGNVFEKPHRKSAKAVGYIIGYYHPHGDTSVYDAIVRLSQSWKMNVPLIDMQGNNGSIDDDPAAAMRYTEARLAKISSTMLEDIDKNCVEFTNNYDDSLMEPTVLPTRFPLLLVNGATGIASGYATNIAPHNINEVIDATIYRINNPECTLDELMEYIKGPDFPTGGIVQGLENIKEVFRTGRGKVVLRSKCGIIENRTVNQIVITEIPYEVVKINLVKKIDEIRINKDVDGISDVRDESGREGLRIVVDIKKDADARMILNYLYKNTDLQINYNYNMIAIVNHRPKLMSLTASLDAFIEFRKESVLRKSKYLLEKKKERIHIIEGLIKAISIMDDVIEIIRRSKDKADAKKRLMEAFLFTDEQSEAIVNLRLYRLTNTDVNILKEEYSKLIKEINELQSIISSEFLLRNYIIKDMKEIKNNFGIERRTKVEDVVEEINIDKMSMITNEPCVISVSRDGYIKRISMRGYNANEGTLCGFKENDDLIGYIKTETLETLLLFTNKGNYIYIPVYQIDESKWKDLGKHYSTYVKSDGDEKIVSAVVVNNFDTYANLVFVTKNGMIKKTPVNEFKAQRYSKLICAMKVKDDDEVVGVKTSYETDEVIITTSSGYYNRYSLDVVAASKVKAQGIKAIAIKDDKVADFSVIHSTNDQLLLITDNGNMKRIKSDELPMTTRATKGNRLFKLVKSRNIHIFKTYMCKVYDSLMLYDGEMNVINVKDVPIMSREATFSSVHNTDKHFFSFLDSDNGIEKVKYIDYPEGYKVDNEDDFTQMNIFE